MRRTIINIVLILIAFAIQNCVFPFIPFLRVAPNLMLIMLFSIGFIYGRQEGIIYGIIIGMLMDFFYSGIFGFFTLIYIWLGYIDGLLSKYFYEDYIVLPLLMCAFNEVLYNLAIYFFRFMLRGKFDIVFYIKTIIIPEMIITLLFTLLLYRPLFKYNKALEIMDNLRGNSCA